MARSSGVTKYSEPCPACGREVTVERFHAGFGNQGFRYCDRDSTVLTWDSYDPTWTGLVGEVHPWMLTPEQKDAVEGPHPMCPCGGRFRFLNPLDATGTWSTESSI